MDLDKYRPIFLEESSEHLAEMSRALLELEKEPSRASAIDSVFRMAHSIKGMAASLGFASIAEAAHELEDRMERVRGDGSVAGGDDLLALFAGLEELEELVAAVRCDGEAPARRAPKKKLQR